MPLTAAHMACSRTPKCILRPWYRRACRAGSRRRRRRPDRVLVLGDRSAAPPISQGICWAMAFSTLPDASRVAMPLAFGGKTGSAVFPSVRQLPLADAVDLLGQIGILGAIALEHRLPCRRAASRRARQCRRRNARARRREPRRIASGSKPKNCLVSLTSSSPSGSPCASGVSCLMRRAVADMAMHDDQRRPILGAQEIPVGPLEQRDVVRIGDAQ